MSRADVLGLLGVVAVTAGVFVLYGLGWALAVGGALMILGWVFDL